MPTSQQIGCSSVDLGCAQLGGSALGCRFSLSLSHVCYFWNPDWRVSSHLEKINRGTRGSPKSTWFVGLCSHYWSMFKASAHIGLANISLAGVGHIAKSNIRGEWEAYSTYSGRVRRMSICWTRIQTFIIAREESVSRWGKWSPNKLGTKIGPWFSNMEVFGWPWQNRFGETEGMKTHPIWVFRSEHAHSPIGNRGKVELWAKTGGK